MGQLRPGSHQLTTTVCVLVCAAPDRPSGLLQGVLLTLVMSLVLLALLVLVLWLRSTGQDGRRKERKAEEEEGYNKIRYTPPMKRSFVWRPSGTGKKNFKDRLDPHGSMWISGLCSWMTPPHISVRVLLNVRVVTSELFHFKLLTQIPLLFWHFLSLRRAFESKTSKLNIWSRWKNDKSPFHSDNCFLINDFKVKTTCRRVLSWGNNQDEEKDFKWTKFSPDRSCDLLRGRSTDFKKRNSTCWKKMSRKDENKHVNKTSHHLQVSM